jgi:two-component system NtrC family sensor kinase
VGVLSQVPWHRRLGFRLIAADVAVTVAVAAALGQLGARAQERQLVAIVVRGAALLSDTIKSSTHQHMLEDHRPEAYATMAAVGAQPGIEGVRIFNKEGRITYSTHPAEVGTSVDKRAESCYACHAQGQPLERLAVASRSRIYRAAGGHRVLGMVTPIYNDPSCSTAACHAHPASQRVLGVVDVGISLAETDGQIETIRRTMAAAMLLGMTVLALSVGLLAHRLVLRPVKAVVKGTQRVAHGDLDHRIEVLDRGEIGVLAQSFNDMTEALRDAQAEIRGLLEGLERQVDERTADLRQAQAALVQSEKLGSLGRMAASVAHEINNPLAGILTFAKLLLRQLAEPVLSEDDRAACLKNLRLIERETARCTTIVRNLLDFARQRPLVLTPVHVRAVVEEALSLVAHSLALKSVAVEAHLDADPVVEGDFGQLRQAFVNIALNAADAMPGGGRLTVRLRPVASGAEVELADTGTGIAAEHLPHIFEPFFSTKEKGTGLGLSVVYGIVQRHGGTIDVDSTLGAGTRMRVRLPGVGTEAVAASSG